MHTYNLVHILESDIPILFLKLFGFFYREKKCFIILLNF